jgi:hypothetical protein
MSILFTGFAAGRLTVAASARNAIAHFDVSRILETSKWTAA